MFRAKGTSISLRDLRIAKLQKRMRITACGPELDTFLAAVAAAGGNEDKVPSFVKKALSNCMEESVRMFPFYFLFLLHVFLMFPHLRPVREKRSKGRPCSITSPSSSKGSNMEEKPDIIHTWCCLN